jgi:AraC-like DNA-binding protein
MDVLSDVLLAVRLTGAIFFSVEARAPFAAESPSTGGIADRVMAGAGHVISFHIVTEGECWTEVIGAAEPAVRLRGGEIVVYPHGDPNVMASAPGMRGQADESLYYRPAERQLPFALTMNPETRGADACRFVCGFLGCDAGPFNPLLDALPRVIRSPVSALSRGWLTSLVDVAVAETAHDSAGSEAMLAKLAELMFVEVMRNHITSLPDEARGWFAGLRDPQIGAALKLIHGRPCEPWTLDGLARETGMSRSSFAERFALYLRMPPMQYLGRWRMQLAARMLEDERVGVAEAAGEVGYHSEAAFNRAFKRHVGVTPGAWRRGRPRATAGAALPLARVPTGTDQRLRE